MTVVFANNAAATLAAAIGPDDGVVVLAPLTIERFPSLAAGQWHPLTIVDAVGNVEVVRVTERDGNVLTVQRGQDGTTARAYSAGARAEIRLTAGVLTAMANEAAANAQEIADNAIAIASNTQGITANTQAIQAHAQSISSINTTIAGHGTDIGGLQGDVASMRALFPPGFGPVPWSLPAEPPGWIFADGRTLTAATPHTALRAAYIAAGFPHGQDAGNPRIPDMRGRTAAGIDSGTGRLAGATIGAALGAQTHTLSAIEMPSHGHGVNDPAHAHSVYDPTHAHGVYDPGHAHSTQYTDSNDAAAGSPGSAQGTANRIIPSVTSPAGTGIGIYGAATGISIYGAGTGISIQANGGDGAHNNVQPTLAVPFIVKT